MHVSLLLLLSALWQVFASAKQATDFNVTAKLASKYECGKQCDKTFKHLSALDLKMIGTRYDPDFYATASNFTGSKPGDLLKLEVMNPHPLKIPDGMTSYRFQYTSADIDGHSVPATGFIAIPYHPAHGRIYRTVAYAHGTIGVFHGCAPSALRNLYDYDSWKPMVEAGYAVIATDYAGLGNNATLHKYLTLPEHAHDLFYSVIAARKAFGSALSKEWMSVGHSQGGGAVWKLAEMEADLSRNTTASAGTYLGTVALAPATRVYDMAMQGLKMVLQGDTSVDLFGELPWLAFGIQRLIPSFHYSLLGSVLKKRLGLAELTQICYYPMIGLVLDLSPKEIFSINDQHGLKTLQQFQNMTAAGVGARNAQPIMVVQGLNDTSVLPQTTRLAWNESCEVGNELHLRQYPGMDHTAVISASAPTWLSWMDGRFKGSSQYSSGCSMVTVRPFDIENMKARSEE